MALSLPYDIQLDGGVNASHVQANFQAIANKFGTLEASDMPSLALPSTQLTASNVEEIVPLIFDIDATKTVTNAVKVIVPVSGTGSYTVQDGRYCTFGLAGGSAAAGNSFVIEAGSYVAGVWTATSTIATVSSWSASYTATQAAMTISTGAFTAPTQLALRITANATPPTSGTLAVSLRITRSLQ